ncbi:MAG: glycosyltransferase [Candidatus Thermoplasmatota archaeon]|nr:glycosyltransferase [Candidatus Thermoplasmatota archaeon]
MTERLENFDLFPLNAKMYNFSYEQYTLRWLINGIGKIIIGDYDLYRKLILKLNRVQLLHAHFGPTGYGLLKIKEKLGLPLITTFYGYDMSMLPRKIEWQKKYQELFEKGDLFLVEGTNMKRGLVALGCPERKIKIQHIAVDINQFQFRAREPKNNEKVTLFFCGRFTEKKGIIYALQAAKHTIKEYSNLEFRIVGDGELRPQLEKYIEENNLNDYVKLLGYQPHHVVAKEMAQTDIFIQPSITAKDGDTEGGAPTIILEAQASGVPVLSTDHADIPEVVLPEKSAFLSKEKDWQGLADNLLRLLRKQDEWAEIGKFGRQHVEAEYNIFTEVRKLEEIYFQALTL